MNALRIEVVHSTEIKDDLLRKIYDWLNEEFLAEGDDTCWSEADWHLLGYVGQQLVSHLDIHQRMILVNELEIRAAGIGGVVTRPGWRGKGFASSLLETARKMFPDPLRVSYGLLMCDQEMLPFYQQFGWKEVHHPLYYDHPAGKRLFPDQVMVHAVRGTPFPPGKIDLQGYPW